MTIGKRFIAPALPIPKVEYDQQEQTDLIRALRLYFNLLDDYFNTTILDALNGGLRGNTITLPHIAASDSTDQRTTDDTATVVNFNTLDSGFGWTLNSPGSATAAVAGVYTIRYSIQFANTDNQQHTATTWLQNNGADVANSATTFSVPARKSASIPGFICAYSEATFSVAVGDEIELYWATDQANVVSPAADGIFLFHDAAQASPFPRPAIPSVIGSIVWVSALPPP
jgi:plastocyanin